MLRFLPATLIALAGLLGGDAAHAGRPLQTEDAGVLDPGDCELELAAARERSRGDGPAASGVRAQVGCGVGGRSQVAAYVGRARAGDARDDAVGLVGKTWLRALSDDATGVAVAWAAGYVRPHGGRGARDGAEVRAVVTHPVGAWLLHGNLGWARDSIEHRDSTVWGAAVERTGLGRLDAMVEIVGDDRDRPWTHAGLRWNAVPGQVAFDASYGRQLRPDGARLVTLGMKFAF